MREAIEELMRAVSSRSHEPRPRSIPRRLRPHVARSTFTPVSDPRLARTFAV